MRKRKRRLALEGLEHRLVLTAPTFDVAALTVSGGLAGGSTFSGTSTVQTSTDPALNGAVTFDLNVTTKSDILVVEARLDDTEGKNLPGGWFNEPLGGANPDLDSFVTTPGSTVSVNGWDLGDQTDSEPLTIFDTSPDGPQEEFTFARITLLPDADGNASAVFSGILQTANTPVPLIEPYEYQLRTGESFNVPNGVAVGTTVGFVSATDADGDAISYSIVDGNADGTFTVNPETGAISVLKQLPESVSSHPLVLEATANGESTTTNVTVNVLFQQNAPVFPATQDYTVDETAAVGTVLGTFAATDADGDALRYGIDFGNFGDFFAYDNATGEIRVANPIDVAVDTTISLDLRVTDSSGLSDREQVNINIIAAPTDPTDVPPSFDGATVSVTSTGDTATFKILGTYVADASSIANNPLLQGAVTYDLAVSTSDDILVIDAKFDETEGMNVPGGWFNDTVNGSDTAPPLPHAITETPEVAFDSWVTTPSQTAQADGISLSTNDGRDLASYFDVTNSGPQSDFVFARITLIPDTNGNASAVFTGAMQVKGDLETIGFNDFEFQLDLGQSLNVDQNAPVGATVGFVTASDLNGDDITYAIVGGNDGDVFAINADTGEIVTQQLLTASNYSLVVEATANGQSVTTTVTINVPEGSGNNAPAFATIDPIRISNNTAVGTVVGSVSATDADGDALDYGIVTRRSSGGRPVSNFAYDAQTGEISVAEAFNVAGDEVFEITLTATDSGGLSAESTVTVNVVDVDQTPVFQGSDSDEFYFGVPEGTAAGTSLGSLMATDPFEETLQYSITQSTAPGLFAVDEATGELTLAREITADDTSGVETGNANFRLVIEARNSGGHAATTTAVIVEGLPINDGENGFEGIVGNWQNSTNPLDVDDNGEISPLDALLVINELNTPKYHIAGTGLLSIVETPPAHFDVSGDNYISPTDALRVINHLNAAEAPSAAGLAFAVDDVHADDDDDDSNDSPFSDRLVDLAFE